MPSVNQLFNLFVMPIAFFTLVLILPPYLVYKLITSLLCSFHYEELSHKVVVITGASSGIGEELAYQYARKGACLVLVARRESCLIEVAKRAQELGSPDVLVVRADVSKFADCERFIQETVNHFGRLDHLVTNAGIATSALFEEVADLHNLSPVMDINFWGSVCSSYYAIPHLKKSRGRIVVVSSATVFTSLPKECLYGSTKAALVNFYETLRVELGTAIQITIVTPGWVESDITKGKFLSKEGGMIIDEEARDALVGLFPVETAEECGKAILKGVMRGDRYVIVPAWYRSLYWFKILCPEVLEWILTSLNMTSPGSSNTSTLGKRLLDWSGAKRWLYPSSIVGSTPVAKSNVE